MSLKHNFNFYVSQEQTRLNDDLHILSNKSKFNLRYESTLIAKDFKDLGFKSLQSATKITPDHIQKLTSYWQEKKYATSTIQSKITTLRHILRSAGNPTVIPAFKGDRDVLNQKNVDKSSYIPSNIINKISDLAVKSAIKLASAYGLRTKEVIYATHALSLGHAINEANILIIKGSWAKNGRPRNFKMADNGKVLFSVQKEILAAKLNLRTTNEQQFRNKINNKIRGLNKINGTKMNMHGFRHSYAQNRYFAITGMIAPAKGGLKFANMNKNEQAKYNAASRTISKELGHNRPDIARVYLGK